MRKIISVILAMLMLFSIMSVSASAATECKCDDHIDKSSCHCCIYCPENPTYAYVTPCHKGFDGKNYYILEGVYCCADCNGFINNKGQCGCTCDCCTLNDDGTIGTSKTPIIGDWDEIWGEEEQENFVAGFQAVLKRISDAFDKFFDAIFEFLRIDGVINRN